MIALKDIIYVRLGTRDLEGSCRYATAVLGLEEAHAQRNPKNWQTR